MAHSVATQQSAQTDLERQPRFASLAAQLSALSFEDLSPGARHSALRCVLDLVACAAAGRTAPIVDAVVREGTRWASSSFPPGGATVWFESSRLSVLGAAFVNSLAGSILDIDDGHRAAAGHPGAAVVPAVLACAEAQGLQLEDVILAIVCGYEAGVRVGSLLERTPHATGASGRWSAVGVAAAVGKLRRLSTEQLAHAMALAESQAPNMMAANHAGFAGSDAKEGIPWSVLTGITAADHASLGFRGYARALDNPVVYLDGAITVGGSNPFLVETTYFKPYAACRWTHASIEAMLNLRREGLRPSAVERIEVAAFKRALSLENLAHPKDIISAQFSIPFVVAVALVEGADALMPMSPDLLKRADIVDIAQRVDLVVDSEFEASYGPVVPSRVTVRTRGQTFSNEVRIPLGDPKNPLTDSKMTDKAVRLCAALREEGAVRNFARGLLTPITSGRDHDAFNALLSFVRQDLNRK